jgi:hypothetical protein
LHTDPWSARVKRFRCRVGSIHIFSNVVHCVINCIWRVAIYIWKAVFIRKIELELNLLECGIIVCCPWWGTSLSHYILTICSCSIACQCFNWISSARFVKKSIVKDASATSADCTLTVWVADRASSAILASWASCRIHSRHIAIENIHTWSVNHFVLVALILYHFIWLVWGSIKPCVIRWVVIWGCGAASIVGEALETCVIHAY